ncbi:DMT family transporter [Atlantibacter subterranea]|uniref:DMT family transporter n=1 Tax=Atlantibacter subterraneus TaxID=255519 RepID=A0A427V8D1_9ENTR|nr:DMT family transporter [Atlantibacter subterranea]RSB59381.1 DMT family transporter [Atlantibacter subterranea]RSE01465.1 DMT family transporter [Atlantibacter subterranea]RSE28947.1 DMT family transporter [Atlantibacter subterranea]
MRNIQSGVWQMSLAMLISGSIGAFVLLSGLPVMEVVFARCLIGGVTLLLFIRLSREPLTRLSRLTLLLMAAGGVAVVINWLLLFASYRHLSIGLSTVIYNTQPFMLVLMSMLLGERVSSVKWAWLTLAFGGVVLVLSSELSAAHQGNGLLGVAMALGAAFFYALTALITRQLRQVSPQQIALVQMVVGTLMLLPLVQISFELRPMQWGILLTVGIVHTGIMYQLLYAAIQKLPTPLTGSLSFIYPLVAVVVDKLVFNHTLSLTQLAGGALILLAAAGNNLGWGEKRAKVINEAK